MKWFSVIQPDRASAYCWKEMLRCPATVNGMGVRAPV